MLLFDIRDITCPWPKYLVEHRAIQGHGGPWVMLEAGGEPLVSRTTDECETPAFPLSHTQLLRLETQTARSVAM